MVFSHYPKQKTLELHFLFVDLKDYWRYPRLKMTNRSWGFILLVLSAIVLNLDAFELRKGQKTERISGNFNSKPFNFSILVKWSLDLEIWVPFELMSSWSGPIFVSRNRSSTLIQTHSFAQHNCWLDAKLCEAVYFVSFLSPLLFLLLVFGLNKQLHHNTSN